MTSLTRDARFFVDGVTKYLRGSGGAGAMLPKVTAALHKIATSARAGKLARVESSVPLTSKEKSDISRFLSRLLSREATLQCTINKELIGGLRIGVGDWIVDTSIATQISAMQEQLTS